jgi:predicted negative regulator of RcsB-dependent stress response
MAEYSTEEEQVRALKQWWERNGASILIGAGLALAIVFGWQWWQQRTEQQAQVASVIYQQLTDAVRRSAEDPEQRATAEHLAGTLVEEHGSSRYAAYARLMLASLQVEAGELDRAGETLAGLLDSDPATDVAQVARLRLARVQFAAGDAAAALTTLDGAPPGSFAAQYEELRGDVLLSRDDVDGALAAYRAAEQATVRAGGVASGLLTVKLRGLEAGVERLATATAAPAQPQDDAAARPEDTTEGAPAAATPAGPAEEDPS